MRKIMVLMVFFIIGAVGRPCMAEEFYCEVLSLEGNASLTNEEVSKKILKEGDLLKAGDMVEVGEGSSLDLAYDKEWNNVIRLEQRSKLTLQSIEPAEVSLEEGGVYAKLRALPKESTFEVRTPTAIASVRGTEYRTTHEKGQTQVYNFSESSVYVFGVDGGGNIKEDAPVVLAVSEKTGVVGAGASPQRAEKMQVREFERGQELKQKVDRQIQANKNSGRVGKIQDIRQLEKARAQRGLTAESGVEKAFVSGEKKRGSMPQNEKATRQKDLLKAMRSADSRMEPPVVGSGAKEAKPKEAPMAAGSAQGPIEKKEGFEPRQGLGQNSNPENKREKNKAGSPPPQNQKTSRPARDKR